MTGGEDCAGIIGMNEWQEKPEPPELQHKPHGGQLSVLRPDSVFRRDLSPSANRLGRCVAHTDGLDAAGGQFWTIAPKARHYTACAV
jgi:hypothetical protein